MSQGFTRSSIVAPAAPITTTLTGNQDAFDPLGASVVFCNNASLLTIRGIKAGYSGQEILFISIGAGQVDFVHENATPVSSDRLINFATVGLTSLAPAKGICKYVYDSTAQRWRLVEHEQGAWINTPYVAGDFSGGGSMVWTVEASDVVQFRSYLKGRELFLAITIQNSSVSGTLNTQLRIKLPGGHTDGANALTAVVVHQAPWQFGMAQASGIYILIYKDASFVTNWAASTNNTWLQLQLNIFVS